MRACGASTQLAKYGISEEMYVPETRTVQRQAEKKKKKKQMKLQIGIEMSSSPSVSQVINELVHVNFGSRCMTEGDRKTNTNMIIINNILL